MSNRSHPTWSSLLLLVLAACATPATADVALDGDAARPVEARDFVVPAGMSRGFDAASPAATWSVGDELLLGLRLRRDGADRSWLLRMRLLEPLAVDDGGAALAPVDWTLSINGERRSFASRLCRVDVTVMDDRGEVLGRSQPLLPRDFLDDGIAGACRDVHHELRSWSRRGRDQAYHRLDVQALAEATVCAVALLNVVQEDDVLAPLLWEVVEKPSVWSVVQNLGARVVLRPRFHAVTEALSPVAGVDAETWRLPMSLFVNDEPALTVDLFVAEPDVPFALCGGVLGATARHPSDPNLEFSLLVLSARRGE